MLVTHSFSVTCTNIPRCILFFSTTDKRWGCFQVHRRDFTGGCRGVWKGSRLRSSRRRAHRRSHGSAPSPTRGGVHELVFLTAVFGVSLPYVHTVRTQTFKTYFSLFVKLLCTQMDYMLLTCYKPPKFHLICVTTLMHFFGAHLRTGLLCCL